MKKIEKLLISLLRNHCRLSVGSRRVFLAGIGAAAPPALKIVFLIALTSAVGWAQGTTATISGTVTDSSGSVIPGADILVKNVGTGQTVASLSDAKGRYRVPDLLVGDYEVQVSKDGFATSVHEGITLTVGSQNVVDFALQVGQKRQTVSVVGAVTQVETTNSTVVSLVDQTQMRELPLNGRNCEQLIRLAPGVQNFYPGSSGNMREGKDPAMFHCRK